MDRQESNKTLLYVLIVVVVILLGIAVYFFFFNGNSESANNNENTSQNEDNEILPTDEPTLRLTPTVTASPTATLTSTPSTSLTISPTTTPNASGTLPEPIQVRVTYSVNQDPNNPSALNSITTPGYHSFRQVRTSRADTENFVMEGIIAGPSTNDATEYRWFTPIALSGESNCGSADFQITKDESANSITVKFCRTLDLSQEGTAGRIRGVVRGGMEQFLSNDSPKTVIVQNRDGGSL